jgi:CDI immunity protein
MGLFDMFGVTKTTIQDAAATLYPDKIVIETVDRIKNSYGVISANVTVLNANVELETLGRTLRHHLNMSRDNLKEKDTKDSYNDYLKAAGFKTRKEHHKNALHLTVHKKDGKIFLEPTINGGPTGKNRGFANTSDRPIAVDGDITDAELGEMIRHGWSKCVCNCA